MEQPILNYYDHDFVFTHSEPARRDQFDECWVTPSNATTCPLKKDKKGFVNTYDEDTKAWTLSPDLRGKTYYSIETGEAVVISTIKVPDNLTDTKPPSEYHTYINNEWAVSDENFILLKEASKRKINAIRDKVEQSIFAFNYRGVIKYIDSNSDAVSRLAVSERLGKAEHWTCANDELIYLEPKELTAMLDALGQHSKKCFEISLLWKAYLDSCFTAQEIETLMAQFSEGVFSAN